MYTLDHVTDSTCISKDAFSELGLGTACDSRERFTALYKSLHFLDGRLTALSQNPIGEERPQAEGFASLTAGKRKPPEGPSASFKSSPHQVRYLPKQAGCASFSQMLPTA